MVAFRKAFPVLAIVAFLLGTATTASAQGLNPLVCNASTGVPPTVRAEGLTELVGDLVLQCTGGNPAQAMTANFQLFLNTNITSRLLSSSVSEALLMIDEPGSVVSGQPICVSPNTVSNSAPAVTGAGTVESPFVSQVPGLVPGGLFGTGTAPTCNPVVAGAARQTGTYSVFKGQPATAANGTANAAVIWTGIPIVPPGTNTRTIRITNVRANASAVPQSASLVPAQIFSFLSISASQSLSLPNPQNAVAFILPGLVFDVRACNGGSSGVPASLVQCIAEPGGSTTLANNNSAGGPFNARLGLRFREGFQTAFKTRIDPGQENSIPGVVFNSESGFVRQDNADLAGVGEANTATRVSARFTGVPEGAQIFVSVSNVVIAGNGDMGSATAEARLVSTDANGAGTLGTVGGSGFVDATTNLNCPAAGEGTNRGAARIPTTSGVGLAVWEVTTANSAAIDTLFFYLAVAYAPNTAQNLPGLGQASVTGSFAPFYAASNTSAAAASTSLPIPRFVDNATPRAAFRIDQCVTNLLFPFVTNQAGFDTGVAISNTSRDPFSNASTRVQEGTCTLNYYGRSTGGPTPSPFTTTGIVTSGNYVVFTLSGGGELGIPATPGFQGYIIAQCRFQYAHGFAFITDGPIGQARVAEGYLALVMDASAGTRTGSISETLAH